MYQISNEFEHFLEDSLPKKVKNEKKNNYVKLQCLKQNILNRFSKYFNRILSMFFRLY